MTADEKYMYRALQLAKIGLTQAMPNPSVGAVIVHNDTIIGEGFTSAYGGAHAEVRAIASVKNKSLLQKSVLYVTLEPCSHYGKTPPCSLLIIDSKIPKVVVGCLDPFSEVSGKGIEMLKNSGVNVVQDVLEEECKASHKRFFTYHLKKRPYILLKWATSYDGFIAPKHQNNLEPFWISDAFSRQLAHRLRAKEMAILVGTTTVLKDNPTLTTRDWKGKNPVRIYIDKSHKISSEFSITSTSVKTICIAEERPEIPVNSVIYEQIDFSNSLPLQLVSIARKHQLQSIIVEGGSYLLQQFINQNLWDEAHVFTSSKILKEGVSQPSLLSYKIEQIYQWKEMTYTIFKSE